MSKGISRRIAWDFSEPLLSTKAAGRMGSSRRQPDGRGHDVPHLDALVLLLYALVRNPR